jgi:hypothetical protein
MRVNVGAGERAIRIGLGVVFLAIGILGNPPVALLFIVVGAALLVTGVLGHCVLYDVLGISTARRKG